LKRLSLKWIGKGTLGHRLSGFLDTKIMVASRKRLMREVDFECDDVESRRITVALPQSRFQQTIMRLQMLQLTDIRTVQEDTRTNVRVGSRHEETILHVWFRGARKRHHRKDQRNEGLLSHDFGFVTAN
jgi:hypothetical protein